MGAFDHRQLNRHIHSRIRLAVVAVLTRVDEAEFTCLRDQVNTTDGNLGGHLRKLENVGYVRVEKSFENRKPVSRYRLTGEGREAFEEYRERLERLLQMATSE